MCSFAFCHTLAGHYMPITTSKKSHECLKMCVITASSNNNNNNVYMKKYTGTTNQQEQYYMHTLVKKATEAHNGRALCIIAGDIFLPFTSLVILHNYILYTIIVQTGIVMDDDGFKMVFCFFFWKALSSYKNIRKIQSCNHYCHITTTVSLTYIHVIL